MRKPSVIFCCEASDKIGSGHVMRCLTVANFLRSNGWDCSFSVSDEALKVVPALSTSGHHIIGKQEAFDKKNTDIVVVDNYSLSAKDEVLYRQSARHIVIFDDLADRSHDCDLLLDQTFGRDPDEYGCLVPDHAVVLTGAEYALVRPEFSVMRMRTLKRRREDKGLMRRVLVTMGGTDPDNVTSIVIDGLAGTGLEIDIVLGAASKHIAVIESRVRALQSKGVKINLHVNAGNMLELMMRADIAVGAGGTTSWERCSLGLPTLLVEVADNQRTIAKNLEEAGAVYNLGRYENLSSHAVSDAIGRFKTSPDLLSRMSVCAAKICDGGGLERMLPYLFFDEDIVTLTPITDNDANIIFEWQNIPGIRKYFRNPSSPSWREHENWFREVIKSKKIHAYIIKWKLQKTGIVRLDVCDDDLNTMEVSVLLDPQYQGRGIAKVALQSIQDMNPNAILMAYVHPDNTASQGLFRSLGYVQKNDHWYRIPS